MDYSPDTSFGHCLAKTHTRLRNSLNRQFAAHGYSITVEQWKAMVYLNKAGQLSANELEGLLFREQSVVSRLVAGLVKKQLVVRMPDPDDRRQRILKLTDKGATILSDFSSIALANLDVATRGISSKDLAFVMELLEKVSANCA